MRKPIIEYVYDYSKSQPEKAAVITKEQAVSYKELFQRVNNYALFLKSKGVTKGDVVVARASQSVEFVVLYLSIHLVGAVITSVEKSMPFEDIANVAKVVGAKFIICEDDFASDSYKGDFISINTVAEYSTRNESLCTWEFPDEDMSADILFTTGTTGSSKGVELSHKALVATAENLIYGCGYSKDVVLIVPGPLNHANPIRKLFTTLVNGSTIYILNGMSNLRDFYQALDYPCERIACCLPPAMIRVIFTLSQDQIGNYADKIDFIESASAPLPEPDKLHLCKLLPKTRLYNNYGSSESASVCMYDYNANPGLENCVGKPMPNSRIIIVDDDKKIMQSSKNNMGLLACDGDVNMKGYIGEPELTAEVLIDGIVYTNDIGYIDEKGFVYVSGRKGDVINVGGLKVAPSDVEAVALSYPGIDDCICIPMDHPISGKVPKLLVVINEGTDFDAKDMRSFLVQRLEGFKVPAKIEIVDHVERTYNGKLNRKAYL